MIDSHGNLFGTLGGADVNLGDPSMIFEVPAGGGALTELASFTALPGNGSGLVEDSSGDLFGTTTGSVFELAAGSNTITTLATFGGGANPFGSRLVEDNNGDLFGSTDDGPNGDGSVFEWSSTTPAQATRWACSRR
jgi:hypothetical protein